MNIPSHKYKNNQCNQDDTYQYNNSNGICIPRIVRVVDC